MRAGSLDRRITILRGAAVDDGAQTTTGELAPEFTRWASVAYVRDGERYAAGETQASVSVRFQVRHDSETSTIEETDAVEFEGKVFNIVGIKELGRRVGFEISATARAEG